MNNTLTTRIKAFEACYYLNNMQQYLNLANFTDLKLIAIIQGSRFTDLIENMTSNQLTSNKLLVYFLLKLITQWNIV